MDKPFWTRPVIISALAFVLVAIAEICAMDTHIAYFENGPLGPLSDGPFRFLGTLLVAAVVGTPIVGIHYLWLWVRGSRQNEVSPPASNPDAANSSAQ